MESRSQGDRISFAAISGLSAEGVSELEIQRAL